MAVEEIPHQKIFAGADRKDFYMPRKKVDKGFFIFYDWVKNLQYMEDGDAWKTVCAYGNFCQTGDENILNRVDAHLRTPLSMMMNQVKRYQERTELCSKAGEKSAKFRQNVIPCSNIEAQCSNIEVHSAPHVRTTNTNTNTDTNTNTNISVSPQSPPRGADERAEEFFAIFWEAYPRKVGKGAAKRHFLKLGVDAALLNRMVMALEVQKQSDQWTRQGGQFIPNPSTWLGESRWEDEGVLPPPRPDAAEDTANPFLAYLRRMEQEGDMTAPPDVKAPCESLYEADFEEVAP